MSKKQRKYFFLTLILLVSLFWIFGCNLIYPQEQNVINGEDGFDETNQSTPKGTNLQQFESMGDKTSNQSPQTLTPSLTPSSTDMPSPIPVTQTQPIPSSTSTELVSITPTVKD